MKDHVTKQLAAAKKAHKELVERVAAFRAEATKCEAHAMQIHGAIIAYQDVLSKLNESPPREPEPEPEQIKK